MKINLVLSGGGVRGFAHLGVIKALLESGFEIAAISGTSSGAVTGAFIAAGYSPDETLKILKEFRLLRLLKGAFSSGIFSMAKFEKIFLDCFPHNSFEELSMPLYISSTNIYKGKTEVFSKGKLIPALLASSSLPVLFKPIDINGQLYLDGGILNNLPVEPFLNSRIPIIGIHVNPVNEVASISSTLKIMERSFNLAVYANIIERIKKCTFLFEPAELGAYSVYAYSKADEIFKIGYKHATEKMPQFIRLLNKLS
ncbi:MAG: patatin-like phospholipase family protein [Bacteroidota bacterium]